MSKLSRRIYKLASRNPDLRAELAPLYRMAAEVEEEESKSKSKPKSKGSKGGGSKGGPSVWQLIWKYTEGRKRVTSPKTGRKVFLSSALDAGEIKKKIKALRDNFGGGIAAVKKDPRAARALMTLLKKAANNAPSKVGKRLSVLNAQLEAVAEKKRGRRQKIQDVEE